MWLVVVVEAPSRVVFLPEKPARFRVFDVPVAKDEIETARMALSCGDTRTLLGRRIANLEAKHGS
jgi:hypothetical protein